MVAIQRRDNLMWAIPGGMVDAGEKATATLKREFTEEALNSNKGGLIFRLELNFSHTHTNTYTFMFTMLTQFRKLSNSSMKTVRKFIQDMLMIHAIRIMPGSKQPRIISMMNRVPYSMK